MYSAASEGNLAAFEAARRQVVRMFIITYVQATLKYAELMDRAAAKGDLDTQLTDQVCAACCICMLHLHAACIYVCNVLHLHIVCVMRCGCSKRSSSIVLASLCASSIDQRSSASAQ